MGHMAMDTAVAAENFASSLDPWAILEGIPLGVLVVDRDTIIQYVNSALTRFLGSSIQVGHRLETVAALASLRDRRGQAVPIDKHPSVCALQGQQVVGEVAQVGFLHSRARWVSVSTTPLKSPDGVVTGSVTFFDPGNVHALADHRVRSLLAMTAHDLRTPLTIIQGYAQLLDNLHRRKELDEDRLLHGLISVVRASRTMSGLITELLDVAKIGTGRLALSRAPFDLARTTRETIAELEGTTQRHRIVLESPTTITIDGDERRIRQAIVNLIESAIHFESLKDYIKVVVKSDEKDAMVSVSWNGTPIPPDAQSRLFELFFHHEDDAMGTHGGLGMGLYLAREYVERHGGRIWIESGSTSGAQLAFRIPV